MKNIHILPTDKPSRLVGSRLNLSLKDIPIRSFEAFKTYNIYITSDEEIKEGDWFMSYFNSFPIHNIKELSEREGALGWKQEDLKNNLKIILTTDQELIKDGVQAIDDEFLEWFVKNPSCEWVDIEINSYMDKNISDSITFTDYKIIIQKEEPKQICEYCKIEITKYGCGCGTKEPKQERKYSEEDLKTAWEESESNYSGLEFGRNRFYEWLEQFKNK